MLASFFEGKHQKGRERIDYAPLHIHNRIDIIVNKDEFNH